MKRIVTEAEVEQRVAAEQAKMAKRGQSLPADVLRAFSRTHLEMTAPRIASRLAPRAGSPVTRPQAAAKPSVPLYLAAERARVSAIIAAAPVGAEVERDEAIASGASVDTFRATLTACTILNSRRRASR